MQLKANNTKKGKTETGQMTKNKKALSHCSTSDDNNINGNTDMERLEVTQSLNQVYRKNYDHPIPYPSVQEELSSRRVKICGYLWT